MLIPTSLTKQPVIEAAFEIRFSKETQVSEIVPGFLFHTLGCTKPVISLPPSQIPKNVRDGDEQLHYAVVSRLEIEGYYIGLSDHGVVISTSSHYQGWSHFREKILHVLNELDKLKLIDNVTRYSLKYVDFFKKEDETILFDKLNINLTMGEESMSSYPINIRIDKSEADFVNVIQVLSHALVISQEGNFDKTGLILDIDSIRQINSANEVIEFKSNTAELLNKLHHSNKLAFFSCLKDSTIEELGPVYE
ncbi:TIGR04255 family protein [Leclercia adecarboxylata]|uniref:TIGR04255 family protein n=1 Tax=Leclercia adecarboxylata TaxID=83655 RepID=UPI0013DF6B31|nr:TIGR04255 family protein [Leclercia adecarboxylata]QIG29971.1 TIGR04255 family protein [Leclercia adecarboxylata]